MVMALNQRPKCAGDTISWSGGRGSADTFTVDDYSDLYACACTNLITVIYYYHACNSFTCKLLLCTHMLTNSLILNKVTNIQILIK